MGQSELAPAADRANAETWRDWVPDAPEPELAALLTRAEVLEELRVATSLPAVKASDLRFWEYRGILPHPVRRRKDGATRALYPHWFVLLVLRLRVLQRVGMGLAQMAGHMRSAAHQFAHHPPFQGAPPMSAPGPAIPAGIREEMERRAKENLLMDAALSAYSPQTVFLPEAFEDELRALLGRLADGHRAVHGLDFTHAEIYLKDTRGQLVRYEVAVPAPAELATLERARAEATVGAIADRPRARRPGESDLPENTLSNSARTQ